MGKEQCICLLTAHDVKPTANRIVIAEALAAADCPMSMKELEYSILSIEYLPHADALQSASSCACD